MSLPIPSALLALSALFAEWTPEQWTVIIASIFFGILQVTNAILAALSARWTATGNAKIDVVARKTEEAKTQKSIVDIDVQKQISDIHTATNGEMSKKFDLLATGHIQLSDKIEGLTGQVEVIKSEVETIKTMHDSRANQHTQINEKLDALTESVNKVLGMASGQ